MFAPADVNMHERPRATAVLPSFKVNYSTCMRLQLRKRRPPKHPPRKISSESEETRFRRMHHQVQAGSGSCAGRSEKVNAPVKAKSRCKSWNNVDPLFIVRWRTRPHNSLSAYFADHSAESLPPRRTLLYNFSRQACPMQGECCWSASFVSSALILVR